MISISFCVTCHGQECDVNSKCIECSLRPLDVFDKYLKHLKSLLAKLKSKKFRDSQKDSSCKLPCKSSEHLSQIDLSFSYL